MKRVKITGRVQGVGFRRWAWKTAKRLGVSGWVRNRPDGSVEALVQGSEEAVGAMLEALGKGPCWARVDAVDALAVEEGGERQGGADTVAGAAAGLFEIR